MRNKEIEPREDLLNEAILLGETIFYAAEKLTADMVPLETNPFTLETTFRKTFKERRVRDFYRKDPELWITLAQNPKGQKLTRRGNVAPYKVAVLQRENMSRVEYKIHAQLDADRELTLLVYSPGAHIQIFSWRTDSQVSFMRQLARPEVIDVFRELGIEDGLPIEIIEAEDFSRMNQ